MTVVTVRAEQAAIMGYLATSWTDSGGLLTPVAWPNTQITPPNDEAYIEPFVNRQEAFNAAFTATDKMVRHPGLLTINVRAPLNEGDGAALGLADDVAALFRNHRIQNIHFRAPTVRDVGPDGPWYRVQVDCPYWRDSLHTHD